MPRFVVLLHDHPTVHWDLFLEHESTLRSWRLAADPMIHDECSADPLPDHRSLYLEYEGPVSGNRGSVRRIATGEYQTLAGGEGAERFRLESSQLDGCFEFRRRADGKLVWTRCRGTEASEPSQASKESTNRF